MKTGPCNRILVHRNQLLVKWVLVLTEFIVSGTPLPIIRKNLVRVQKNHATRLHSSRLHTARSLTVSLSTLYSGGGGMPAWSGGGMPGAGGCLVPGGLPGPGGVPAWSGGGIPACTEVDPPRTEWQTGAKILPCPKLRLRAIKITREANYNGKGRGGGLLKILYRCKIIWLTFEVHPSFWCFFPRSSTTFSLSRDVDLHHSAAPTRFHRFWRHLRVVHCTRIAWHSIWVNLLKNIRRCVSTFTFNSTWFSTFFQDMSRLGSFCITVMVLFSLFLYWGFVRWFCIPWPTPPSLHGRCFTLLGFLVTIRLFTCAATSFSWWAFNLRSLGFLGVPPVWISPSTSSFTTKEQGLFSTCCIIGSFLMSLETVSKMERLSSRRLKDSNSFSSWLSLIFSHAIRSSKTSSIFVFRTNKSSKILSEPIFPAETEQAKMLLENNNLGPT